MRRETCEHRETRVADSRQVCFDNLFDPSTTGVRRRRVCVSCGASWRTIEISEADVHLWEAYHRSKVDRTR